MLTIKNYVVAESLAQAYELNQSRNNKILGGMLWMKMSDRNINTAIDLSGLSLNTITETENAFEIGCMCTLRQLETNKALNTYFNGIIAESVKHIVGVQFRNVATIGGSIFSRFGFSDILTSLMCLDSYVELYKGGTIPLEEYAKMPFNNDILVKIITNKTNSKAKYFTYRNQATDFPVIACSCSYTDGKYKIVLGATPKKAQVVFNGEISDINKTISEIVENYTFGTNMRGSAEYRKHLASVYIKRIIAEVTKNAD